MIIFPYPNFPWKILNIHRFRICHSFRQLGKISSFKIQNVLGNIFLAEADNECFSIYIRCLIIPILVIRINMINVVFEQDLLFAIVIKANNFTENATFLVIFYSLSSKHILTAVFETAAVMPLRFFQDLLGKLNRSLIER